MGAVRYNHRRVSPAELTALLRRADVSVSDFMYLTGRRREQVERFLTEGNPAYTPTMGDILILELAAELDDSAVDRMFEIAGQYDEGPKFKREKRQ